MSRPEAERAEQPQPHANLSGSRNPSRKERDKSSTIYDGGSEASQWNESWLSTRTILRLVIVSVVLSFIIVLSRSPALWPSFLSLKALSQISLDATSQEKSLPKPIPNTAFSSNGRTDQVQWDNYTLILQGQRVLI
jgi:hypothetical protein